MSSLRVSELDQRIHTARTLGHRATLASDMLDQRQRTGLMSFDALADQGLDFFLPLFLL